MNILKTKNPGMLSSALLLGGNAMAQYSPTPAFEGKIGKYHATHSSDASQAGPFNRWPTGRGFDHYFGYSPDSGADDQWHPTLYRDTQREPEDPQ